MCRVDRRRPPAHELLPLRRANPAARALLPELRDPGGGPARGHRHHRDRGPRGTAPPRTHGARGRIRRRARAGPWRNGRDLQGDRGGAAALGSGEGAAARARPERQDRRAVQTRSAHGGRVMVSDFGVARRAADVNLTADGTVIGTPPFMSPEQCAGRRTGPQSDQYSLGVVGFQMLCGAVPFQADTIAGVMQHHFFTPAPDVRQARDDVPAALAEVLNRTLQKDPAARFRTTRDLLVALEAIPFSESDRGESEQALRQLVQGTVIAKVPTRSLPPLPDGPTQPLAAAGPRKRRMHARA